jgi:hypothetical protein
VYVQPFPGPGPKRQVSISGGTNPVWSRDGRELLFIEGDKLMTLPMEAGRLLATGKPQPVFSGMTRFLPGVDMLPDGHFVMIRRSEEETSSREIRVILNFFDELKRVAPPAR